MNMTENEATGPAPSSDDPWQDVLEDTSGLPIFLTYDPDGVPVYLSKAVWTEHILLRHPEVEPFKGLISSIIADPDSRQRDPEDDRILLYYGIVREDHRPFRKALFLRVVVKYVYPPRRRGRRTGLISAVYFVDRMKRGAETL